MVEIDLYGSGGKGRSFFSLCRGFLEPVALTSVTERSFCFSGTAPEKIKQHMKRIKE